MAQIKLFNNNGESKIVTYSGNIPIENVPAIRKAAQEGFNTTAPRERWVTKTATINGNKVEYQIQEFGRRQSNSSQAKKLRGIGIQDWRDHKKSGEQRYTDPNTGEFVFFNIGTTTKDFGSATVARFLENNEGLFVDQNTNAITSKAEAAVEAFKLATPDIIQTGKEKIQAERDRQVGITPEVDKTTIVGPEGEAVQVSEVDVDQTEIDQAYEAWKAQSELLLSDTPEGEAARNELRAKTDLIGAPFFDEMTAAMENDREITMKGLQESYENAIASINLASDIDKENKAAAIQDLTGDFINTSNQLNFNKKIAYESAVSTLKKTAIDFGNAASRDYLARVAQGQTGTALSQDELIEQVNLINADTLQNFNQAQEQIRLNTQNITTQLAQAVGSERAEQIVAEQTAAGKIEEFDVNQFLTGIGVTPPAPAVVEFGDFRGSIERGAEQAEAKRDLAAEQAKISLTTGQEKFKAGTELTDIQREEARKAEQEKQFQSALPSAQDLNLTEFLKKEQEKLLGINTFQIA